MATYEELKELLALNIPPTPPPAPPPAPPPVSSEPEPGSAAARQKQSLDYYERLFGADRMKGSLREAILNIQQPNADRFSRQEINEANPLARWGWHYLNDKVGWSFVQEPPRPGERPGFFYQNKLTPQYLQNQYRKADLDALMRAGMSPVDVYDVFPGMMTSRSDLDIAAGRKAQPLWLSYKTQQLSENEQQEARRQLDIAKTRLSNPTFDKPLPQFSIELYPTMNHLITDMRSQGYEIIGMTDPSMTREGLRQRLVLATKQDGIWGNFLSTNAWTDKAGNVSITGVNSAVPEGHGLGSTGLEGPTKGSVGEWSWPGNLSARQWLKMTPEQKAQIRRIVESFGKKFSDWLKESQLMAEPADTTIETQPNLNALSQIRRWSTRW